MKKRILTIITLFAATYSFGQEHITVEQYREKVLSYSQILKQSKENLTASISDIKAAKSNLYPKIDAGADFNYLINKINFDLGGGNKLSVAQVGYSATMTAAQNIYSGGVVKKQIEALKISSQIAEQTLEQTRENVCYAADLNYWRLAAMASFKKAAIDYLNIIKKNYIIIKDRYNDGLISKNDLLMIETRLQDAEYQLSDVEKQYEDASITVNLLMGAAPDKVVLLADSLLTEPMIVPEYKDLHFALDNRPEFSISERQIEGARQSLKIMRSQYLPKLAVGLTGQYGTPSPNLTGKALGTAVAFGQLKIPIYAGSEKKHKSASIASKIRSSEYERQKVIDDIYKELSVAWSNITNTYDQISVAQQNVKIAEESLDLNTFSYNEGVLTILDVLSAQLSWLNAYNNLISTHFSFLQAKASYTKAIGTY